VRTLLSPLLSRSAKAQATTVFAGTSNESVVQASAPSVGVGTGNFYICGHDR
jgi:hypothetical protein